MLKETKEDRFKRVATKRVQRILREYRLLGNCSNRSTYAFTDSQIKKIWASVEEEHKNCKSKFKVQNQMEFSL